MKIEQLEDMFCITSFNLNPYVQLAYLSPDLSDAALLEIVLQALLIVFAYASKNDVSEMLFMLPQDDAVHLINFKDFFDDSKSIGMREKSKPSFIGYNTVETRGLFLGKIKSIKMKMKQQLWKAQKTDCYIRDYLQNHQRGMLLPFVNFKAQEIKPKIGEVIPFYQCRKK